MEVHFFKTGKGGSFILCIETNISFQKKKEKHRSTFKTKEHKNVLN